VRVDLSRATARAVVLLGQVLAEHARAEARLVPRNVVRVAPRLEPGGALHDVDQLHSASSPGPRRILLAEYLRHFAPLGNFLNPE
jgi:hypothetical protein